MPQKLKKFSVYLMKTCDISRGIMAIDAETACKQVLENKFPNIFSDLPWHIEAEEDEEN